eukprot:3808004-Pyramimonas_sp.AAC.1
MLPTLRTGQPKGTHWWTPGETSAGPPRARGVHERPPQAHGRERGKSTVDPPNHSSEPDQNP